MFETRQHQDVTVAIWNDGENRLHAASVAAWHTLLDDLEARPIDTPAALVVTGTGKFFSNGLDLEWLSAHPDEGMEMLHSLNRLFGRLLLAPWYCVAALNGHTFAAGAMIACAFDHVVMRTQRGYWCLPEADLGLPLTDEMFAVVSTRLHGPTLSEAINTARRYSSEEALAERIVDQICEIERLEEVAIQRAQVMATKSRKVIAKHKVQIYRVQAARCGVDPS